MKTKLLFVCSGDLDRSPTAAGLFANSEKYEAKSAGTHNEAVLKVSQELIDWADYIFTLCEKEDGHYTFLKKNFDTKNKDIFDLDIPDVYDKNDTELISILKQKISHHLPSILF